MLAIKRAVAGVLAILVLCSTTMFAGTAEPQAAETPSSEAAEPGQLRGREIPPSPEELKIERQRQKALNKQRQEDLKRDTDKLLQLATELKEYVDKSNENTLSLEVTKKAEQIEKLAKSVRTKMMGQ